MNDVSARLASAYDLSRVAVYTVEVLIPKALLAGVVFGGFYLLWRALRRVVAGIAARSRLDDTAVRFSQAVVKYAVLTVGAVSALAQLGVNMVSVMTSLGIAGITIGFAARDALSNVISGLFIFIDRPFVIGDLIEIGPHYGRVEDITMRSTRVVTPDGRMLAIPNTEILNSTVASYTNFPHLRLDVAITIGVNEDLARARRVLLEAVAKDGRFLADPAPVVVVKALNDYNIEIELRVWLEDERRHIGARGELRELALETLRTAGVEMPFETFALSPVTVQQAS